MTPRCPELLARAATESAGGAGVPAPLPAAVAVPQEPTPLAAWAQLIENLNEAVWLVQADTLQVCAVNESALRLLQRSRQEVLAAGADTLLPTPEDFAFWAEAAAQGEPAAELSSETLLPRADGSTLYLTRRIRPLPPRLYMVALQDHSAQRAAEQEREQLLAQLRATLESTADGILVTDLAGRIRSFNRRFAQIWALPEALLHSGNDAAVYDWMRSSVSDPVRYQQRLDNVREAVLMQASDRLRLRSGQVLERVTQPQWINGRPIGRVYSFRDLSERIAADQRIERLASTDPLTGLANRAQFGDMVARAAAAALPGSEGFALLVLDLDHFKQVNDSLGHQGGDRVLCEMRNRLQHCVREGDMVARLGGDQFALLVRDSDARGAELAAGRVLEAVARPLTLEGAEFTLTCSIGIAVHPIDGSSADELLRHAETAMQRAKAGGRSSYRLHHPVPQPLDARSRIRLDHAMRLALASKRFRLAYQPQHDLDSGRVIGVEALLRWYDPERGSDISPAEFIPVAEASGFIVAIGEWVLTQAVHQAAQWQRQGWKVPVAVNVSALQFQQPYFVDQVQATLDAASLPPQLLELELTESILLQDAQETLARLQALAQLGVRLAVDDFGTGYSSLAYLKRFPINKLKIDRGFVRGLPGDDSDAAIVRAIVQMARALELGVIAEGVETREQRDFLAQIGCHEGQGYLWAPALEAELLQQRFTEAAQEHGPA
ncbi:putative bifunctional diguanylate cyclase/phosphodiesterase [Azohydromonas caseinilytica]|uniref:EAL domain-containing protein n=1 Tax=Azohydromonas caseinilytica TaxID=2728836 RepID=A0A848F7V7_9BURK|nr:bifunctional diguanylate cyclase/phosphodiesterase [Azohydromonas caseinilytica]NML16197.1 EAL domain-containing protein [Azohydromonas caseinilytica]